MTDPLINYPWYGRLVKNDLLHGEVRFIPEDMKVTVGELRDVLDSMTNFSIKDKAFFLFMLQCASEKISGKRNVLGD